MCRASTQPYYLTLRQATVMTTLLLIYCFYGQGARFLTINAVNRVFEAGRTVNTLEDD